jgi:hypothetical protein
MVGHSTPAPPKQTNARKGHNTPSQGRTGTKGVTSPPPKGREGARAQRSAQDVAGLKDYVCVELDGICVR